MIVCLRGTNGAGKTTAFRQLFAGMTGSPVYESGRRKPIGCVYHMMHYRVFVLGHYEDSAVNGGFDTLRSPLHGHEIIQEYVRKGMRVFYEGRAHAADIEFVIRNHVLPVYLVVPSEICVASVRQRGHRISQVDIERIARRHEHEKRELRQRHIRYLETDRHNVVKTLAKILTGGESDYDDHHTHKGSRRKADHVRESAPRAAQADDHSLSEEGGGESPPESSTGSGGDRAA